MFSAARFHCICLESDGRSNLAKLGFDAGIEVDQIDMASLYRIGFATHTERPRRKEHATRNGSYLNGRPISLLLVQFLTGLHSTDTVQKPDQPYWRKL